MQKTGCSNSNCMSFLIFILYDTATATGITRNRLRSCFRNYNYKYHRLNILRYTLYLQLAGH